MRGEFAQTAYPFGDEAVSGVWERSPSVSSLTAGSTGFRSWTLVDSVWVATGDPVELERGIPRGALGQGAVLYLTADPPGVDIVVDELAGLSLTFEVEARFIEEASSFDAGAAFPFTSSEFAFLSFHLPASLTVWGPDHVGQLMDLTFVIRGNGEILLFNGDALVGRSLRSGSYGDLSMTLAYDGDRGIDLIVDGAALASAPLNLVEFPALTVAPNLGAGVIASGTSAWDIHYFEEPAGQPSRSFHDGQSVYVFLDGIPGSEVPPALWVGRP